MTTSYTPGPWRYQRENGSPTTGQHMIAGARPGYLAEVRDCGSGDVSANAQLIAAAPDLLEALSALVKQDDDDRLAGTTAYVKGSPMYKKWQAARAAIAKAGG